MEKKETRKPNIKEPVSPINILFLTEKLYLKNPSKEPLSDTDKMTYAYKLSL